MKKAPVTEIRSDPDTKSRGLNTICTVRAPSDVVPLSSSLTLSAVGGEKIRHFGIQQQYVAQKMQEESVK